MRDCNKFSGIGPHFGFGARLHFGTILYFYGNISGSLVYGLFEVYHQEKFIIITKEEKKEEIEIPLTNCSCQIWHAFVPIYTNCIACSTDFDCNKVLFTLKFAFDAQCFWHVNQIIENSNPIIEYRRISEDLSIHGITYRLDY